MPSSSRYDTATLLVDTACNCCASKCTLHRPTITLRVYYCCDLYQVTFISIEPTTTLKLLPHHDTGGTTAVSAYCCCCCCSPVQDTGVQHYMIHTQYKNICMYSRGIIIYRRSSSAIPVYCFCCTKHMRFGGIRVRIRCRNESKIEIGLVANLLLLL